MIKRYNKFIKESNDQETSSKSSFVKIREKYSKDDIVNMISSEKEEWGSDIDEDTIVEMIVHKISSGYKESDELNSLLTDWVKSIL